MIVALDVANLVRRGERAQRSSQDGANENGQRSNGFECFHGCNLKNDDGCDEVAGRPL